MNPTIRANIKPGLRVLVVEKAPAPARISPACA